MTSGARNVPKLGVYLEHRGGEYRRPNQDEVLSVETVKALLRPAYWRGPATLMDLDNGEEAIYTFVSWVPGKRPLCIIRYSDGKERDPANIYDDTAIDSLITVPKNKPYRTYTLECNACGKPISVRARIVVE